MNDYRLAVDESTLTIQTCTECGTDRAVAFGVVLLTPEGVTDLTTLSRCFQCFPVA